MKKDKQSGFYMLEALIAISIFLGSCFTLLPLQYHVLLEQKVLTERDYALYFLSERLHEAWLSKQFPIYTTYHEITNQPLTLEITDSSDLLKGCVTWLNEKDDQTTQCLYLLLPE
ncbi:type II secretion system protein [Gracilibacillus alcaliphilus]|uniref:type II secretion system protein n=1 Tax=Gracilibacillus alcaliphilus TaxID=1401441 RepID=UPI001956C6C4|nr:type II secretion system protein [Gracilibacillus alcaliphilus]MBM7675036.1 type II secretory pathway pseudopilin PulG [Gracilibacillus alcaliphilus]